MKDELDVQLQWIAGQLRKGRVVPFLGAGANLMGLLPSKDAILANCPQCGQPVPPANLVRFDPQQHRLPSGIELARYLAEEFGYPESDAENLVRVTQYIALELGTGPLYDTLRELFDWPYPTTGLHDLLARLPKFVRDRGGVPLQLMVTTNYDDLLERAFRAADEPIDVLTYMAVGESEGRFIHVRPDGEPHIIDAGEAEGYAGLPQEGSGLKAKLLRPVILKIHGTVDRSGLEPPTDSFVITEEDYIEYLARAESSWEFLPRIVKVKLTYSHFLFLGYSLRDWNVRALLHRIWMSQAHDFQGWAIQHSPAKLDQKFWQGKGIKLLGIDLAEFTERLGSVIESLPAQAEVRPMTKG